MFLEHFFFHVLRALGWSGRQFLSSYDHCIPGKGAAVSLAQQQTWEGPEDAGTERVPSPDQQMNGHYAEGPLLLSWVGLPSLGV